MSEKTQTVLQPRPRLKFIDMARSFAILLMLEGHFTGAALADEYRSDEYWLYSLWHNLHGLTSPLFFTVTGLIFVYLLSGSNDIAYLDNQRVKKGFKRVRELLFWGYLIQVNLWSISKSIYHGSEFYLDWLYAFHVLQSIAVGIFFLLIIYGLYKWLNKGHLFWYYMIGGLSMMVIYAWLKHYIMVEEGLIAQGIKSEPTYLPESAPKLIQNMIYGQYSDFSFVRYSGYTILGGMLGALIRLFETKAKEWWFGVIFILAGLVLNSIQGLLFSFDNMIEWTGITENSYLELLTTPFARFGQVAIVLGILMLIDKYFNIKSGLFLKIGQNTLPIYVVHVIILYGGVFGFGLKPNVFDVNQHPLVAASISLTAILAFAVMVKYIEPLEEIYNRVKAFVTFEEYRKKIKRSFWI
jgi:hypothetical protein